MKSFQEALVNWEARQAEANAASLNHELAFGEAVLNAGGSNAEQRKANALMDGKVQSTKATLADKQLAAEVAKQELAMAGKMHVIQKMQEAGITALPH